MTAEVREPIVLSGDGEGSVAGFALASGWAHETPRLRGVTDRAMQWLADTPGVTAQWHVDALVTYLWVSGSPRSVRIGLSDVFRQARRPVVPVPLTHTGSLPDPDAGLLMARWGLRGFGLQGWRRLGFVSAEADEIAAVLSRIGPRNLQLFALNAEVDVSAVPDVDVASPPEPDFPPPFALPALVDAGGGFAMGWQAPRRDAVLEGLVRRAVGEAVRLGDPDGSRDPDAPAAQLIRRHLGSQGSHTAVVVPAGLSDEATAALADRLHGWARSGPSQGELDDAIRASYDARPRSRWDMVRGAVEDALLGGDEEPWEPDAESARQGVTRMFDSLLVVAPEVSTATRLADPRPAPAVEPLDGDTYRCVPLIRRERRGIVVTAGAQGAGIRTPEGSNVILRRDVAAVERWPPGGQLLVTSLDGRQLFLDPAELSGGDRMAEQIRALAPDAVVQQIETRPASPSLIKAYRVAGGWALTALVLFAPAVVLAALLLLGALAGTGSDGDRAAMAVVGLVFAALAGMAGLRVTRLRRVGRSVRLGPWGRSASEVRRGRGSRV